MNFHSDMILTREWLEAGIFFFITLIGIAILRRFLHTIATRAQWKILIELNPHILRLAYAISLGVLVDSAPLPHRVSTWAENCAYVIIVGFLLILVRRVFLIATDWSTQRVGAAVALEQGFVPVTRNAITLLVFTMGSIMVLKHFGYDVISLLTALGVGSLAVGLAAKETLSNMISGFVLIMDRNLKPGDRMQLGTITGDVEEIGLRSTLIRTGDGNRVIVPNFDLVNNRIVNLSEPSRASTCTTQIRVPYSADFSLVKEVCIKILAITPKVDQRRSPWVNLTSLTDGFQLISIGCWIGEMDDCGEVLTFIHQNLLQELRAQGINLIDVTKWTPTFSA